MLPRYRVERWQGIFALNVAMMRSALTSEGYQVFQWCDQPGIEYGPHFHTEDQSHWIISGSLEIDVDGFGSVLLEAGDRDFMPAGQRHRARVFGEEPVLYLVGAKK